MRLSSGHTVLLTGASGGIGRAIAFKLGATGAKLILTGRRKQALELLGVHLDAETIVADLTEREQVEGLIEQAQGVDVFVANAALPASGLIDDFTDIQIDRAIDVNLRAPILMAKALKDGMVGRGHGHLVFVSSISGKVSTSGSSLYSATKFGIRGFAGALRQDLHGSGVGVSAVFPGAIRDAGMWAETGIDMPFGVGTSSPDEVADAIIRAIERDKGEVDVAPPVPRLSSKVAQIAPAVNAAMIRRLGGAGLAAEVAAAQAEKR